MATKERAIIENLFMIADKVGNDVPFIFNSIQEKLDTHFTGRDIIPKARQEGVSSYYLARFTAKCLHKRNTRAVVISHEEKATQRMLGKVHYFLQNLRGPKAVIKHASRNEITFPKTDSMFYIGTAGARKFGRGDTITDLHCSEVAFWPDPKDLLGGLFQAVPMETGEIGIESTGNGKGNYYHRQVMRAKSGQSRYHLHFFNWQDFEEYCKKLSPEQEERIMSSLDAHWDEPELVEKFGLSAGQIAFRREKLEEMDYDLGLFKQEYPMTLDECFQATGKSLFTKVNLVVTPDWLREDRFFYRLKDHPIQGRFYAIGADVGAGVGKDNSTAQIVDLQSLEQVGEWVDNGIEPDLFGHKLNALGREFNNAFLTVESNNHGIVTLQSLRDGNETLGVPAYPSHLLYREFRRKKVGANEAEKLANLGFRTSSRTKPFMIGKLRKYLAEEIIIHSESLRDELNSFIETETGQLQAEEGCLDDRVIALAVAVVSIEKSALVMLPSPPPVIEYKPEDDPFCLDFIIDEQQSKYGGFPIEGQTEN